MAFRAHFLPDNRQVTVEAGTTLLQAAVQAGIRINSVCGGEGICGKCRMVVTKGQVSGGVSAKLTRDEIKAGVVLGCLAIVESDTVVTIPALTVAKEKLSSDRDAERFRDFDPSDYGEEHDLAPLVRKIFLKLDPPSLANNIADHQRLCTEIRKTLDVTSTQTGLKIIRTLPALLRKHDFCVTALVGIRGKVAEVMSVEGGDTHDVNYIAVVDIGTTTMVCHLVDAATGATKAARACFNSQGIYGREVTARMIAAEKKGNDELQKVLVNDINQLLSSVAQDIHLDTKDINAIVCAGNTAMSHFLLGLPVENIRRFPFIAASVEPPPLRAAEVGVQINPRGLLYSLPGVGAWIGGDVTAGILATGMHRMEEISLLVDIGTNGEVVVGNREWLMACSASAGPALEGASVECGVRAEVGAVEQVFVEAGQIRYKTIGDAPSTGICGSGIIDLIAVLLREGIISRSGKFVDGSSPSLGVREGLPAFYLVKEPDRRSTRPIFITESEIENVITAKAAIYAAIKILLARLDMKFSDLSHFFLAGAFGKYINIENAIAIGLIPNIGRGRISFVGNTSIKGAKMVAMHQEAFDTLIEIEKSTTCYDLLGATDYVEEFRQAMFLPHTDIEAFTGPGV
jgi:uncharacterized 2Fe-2S/4Fe-4S cluster protein (DUF4445 family)